ncbi:MAG: glycerophosphodiester phosphodiesterase [Bacilli bacterium]|nr:glycerophosphodiester phosphodiesterase [Bacilli bacterium]
MKNLDFLKSNLIAHRGLHNKDIPENSIKAFKNAIKYNYIIELDVHLLKDNTIIVFHDDNTKRMTGINKVLKNSTYDEIKDLKLKNTNQKIPTLEETLKTINEKVPVIIELKYDQKTGLLEKELVKILDNYKGKFCIKSFNPLSIRWFKKHRPNYIRGLLINYKKKNLFDKINLNKLTRFLCKPDFISCSYKLHNNKTIKKYMKKKPVLAWTIKNNENFSLYKDKFYNLIIDNDEFINKGYYE